MNNMENISPIIIGDNTEVIRILTDKGILHMLEIVDGEYQQREVFPL